MREYVRVFVCILSPWIAIREVLRPLSDAVIREYTCKKEVYGNGLLASQDNALINFGKKIRIHYYFC